MPMGTAVMAAIRSAGDSNVQLQGLMSEAYVIFGIRAWSFTGEDEAPILVTPSHRGWAELVNRLLPWSKGGMELVDAADALYSEDILRPLTSRTSKSSKGGQMDGSTSATPPTSATDPKPSLQSLPMPTEDGRPSADPDR